MISNRLFVPYNPHSDEQMQSCLHQPFTLASVDLVENEELRNDLINDCYFDRRWCSTITPLGGYFCEIAASLAYLQGIPGVPVEVDWWKDMSKMTYQKDFCQLCGACIPMERQVLCNKKQKISKSFLKMLLNNNLPIGDFELFEHPMDFEYMKKWAKTWKPGAYRQQGDICACEDTEPLGSTLDWEKYNIPPTPSIQGNILKVIS